MSAPSFPTADEVARVLVAACGYTGDDPLAVASGDAPISARGRAYAFVALAIAFPALPQATLGRLVGGARHPSFVAGALGMARKRPGWWSHGTVNACLRAIGRPDATEEDAEIRRLKVTTDRKIVEGRAGARA